MPNGCNRQNDANEKIFYQNYIFVHQALLGTLIHHRHRLPVNAFIHLFAGLISYQTRDDKPLLDQLLKLNP